MVWVLLEMKIAWTQEFLNSAVAHKRPLFDSQKQDARIKQTL